MPDTLLGGIAINEVLVDPNSAGGFNTDTDGSGAARGGDEYLELINTSTVAIDISGLELWDNARGNWFTFPPGTVLQPGAHAVVVRNVQNGGSLPSVTGNNLAFDADFGQGVFNNTRDNIVVYDPSNDEYIQAIYNGDTFDDPTTDYTGFSATATRSGSGEDFGNDVDGRSIQRTSTGFANNQTPTPGGSNICFVGGTRILTTKGYKKVENLRPGDLAITAGDGPQPIQWVFARRVTRAQAAADRLLWPVSIKAPMGQLLVSRQHRVVIRVAPGEAAGAVPSMLVPSKDLLEARDACLLEPTSDFFYFHILLDEHHVLNAEGVAAESLLLGPMAWEGMTASAQADLMLLFPNGVPQDFGGGNFPRPCLASGRKVRLMLAAGPDPDSSHALSFDQFRKDLEYPIFN